MRPPAELWETLAEIEHERLTAEMNAERLEDSTTPERAKHWWHRATELGEEFSAYADKHGIQLNDDDEEEETDR